MKAVFFSVLFFSFLSVFGQNEKKVLNLSDLTLAGDKVEDISDFIAPLDQTKIDSDTVFSEVQYESKALFTSYHQLNISAGNAHEDVVILVNWELEYFDVVKYSSLVDTEYLMTGRNYSPLETAYYSTFTNSIPIDVRPNEEITLYVRSAHSEPFEVAAEIKNFERFDKRVRLRLNNSYIFTSILLAFAVYNFILSFFVRQRVYFYYSFYVLSLTGYAGLAALTTILPMSIVSTLSIVFSAIVIALGALFSGAFLAIKKHLAKSIYFYRLLLYSAPVLGLLLLFNHLAFNSKSLEGLTIIYTALLGLTSVLFWLWAGFSVFKTGDIRGRLFLITNIPILIGAVFFIMVWMSDYLSLMDTSNYLNFIAALTFQICILLQLFLFSIVIGHNITQLQFEKLQIEKEQNVKLEQKVAERTADLVKANESISQQKTELAEMNTVKDKLFSIVSHDLRGPLNSVKSILGFLQEGKLSQEEIKLYGQTLEGSVNGTMNLLNNILYWAKSQMEGIEANPTEVDLKTLIEKNIRLSEFEYQKKDIKVNAVLSTDSVYADHDMIDLVIRNLLSNAIKFTGSSGKIELRTDLNGDYVDMIVKDNGIGMTDEIVNDLFNWDTAVASYGTNNEKGYGLGLKLCKDFVEVNHGKVTVESKEGEGSSFTISLPTKSIN